jgi:hypothetical protein
LKGRETAETVFLTAVLSDFAVFLAALEATECIEAEERLVTESLRHIVILNKRGILLYDTKIAAHLYWYHLPPWFPISSVAIRPFALGGT